MSSSRYKRYRISEKKDIATSTEKEIITAITYEFGCVPATPASAVPTIDNTMGQEDLYREDPVDTRVLNSGTARVIWTTAGLSSSIVYCDPDPGSGVAPTTEVVNEAALVTYHEVFWTGLALDTLYKFYVRSINASGDEISGYYYFLTGGTLDFTQDDLSIVLTSIVGSYDLIKILYIGFTEEVVLEGQEIITVMSIDLSDVVQAPDLTENSVNNEALMYTNTVVI